MISTEFILFYIARAYQGYQQFDQGNRKRKGARWDAPSYDGPAEP